MASQRRQRVRDGVRRLVIGWCALSAALVAHGFSHAGDKLSIYTYSDTKALVTLVEDAARLMERDGEAAFKQFAVRGSRWLNGDLYLFAYTIDGVCVFHPITPELVGRNVLDLRDLHGKPIIQNVTDIGRKPGPDASGWVFYFWENQVQLTPSWKSTYVRKVLGPNGKTYVVGAGLYDIKVERMFIEDRVNLAADVLKRDGKEAAFKQFQDPASPFFFLNSYIFVLNEEGTTIIDPAFPTLAGRDLRDFTDVVGFRPIKEVLAKLKDSDAAWVQYLWLKPGSPTPQRKLIYARKQVIGDETLIVGSDFFVATPIWMRVEDDRSWPRSPPG